MLHLLLFIFIIFFFFQIFTSVQIGCLYNITRCLCEGRCLRQYLSLGIMGTLLFCPPARRYNTALDLGSAVQPTHKAPAVWDRGTFFFFFFTPRALLFRGSLTLSEMVPNPTLYRGLKANLQLFRLCRVWQPFITTRSRVALALASKRFSKMQCESYMAN